MKNVLLKLFLLSGIFFPPQKGSSQNVLIDGNFSTTTSITPYYTDPPPLNMWLSWANFYGTGASFTTSVQNGVCSYFIDNPGTNMYDVQLAQYGFPLTLNHRYRLSFDVKADAERDFGVFIGEYGVFSGSWTNLNPSYTRHATADWQTIIIDVDATALFALNKLSFEMGIQKINMHFAKISLIDLGPLPVVIAGSFQHASGCSNDWDPTCNFTALTYNASTGLWSGTFDVPSGCHQYKVTIGGGWTTNYGENGILGGANISLYVPEETLITFTYDPSTHFVTTSPFASGFSTSCLPQVVLTGSFQNELGCSNDWDANCSNSALIYVPATGQFENDFNLPPGFYEYRAILNGDWAGNNFGDGGKPNGSNYFLYMPCAAKVHFSYNPITHIVTAAVGQPNTVVIAGSFQSEVGCTGDWQPDCNNTRMKFDPYSGNWVDTIHIPAGHWEYKITINNSWDENYGLNGERNGQNIQLDLCAPAKVIFTYFHSECYNYNYVFAYAIADQPNTVVIAGSFQSEVGCTGDWQPDCNSTRMEFEPGNDTLFMPDHWVDTLLIPAGHWEYKFTVNNSWNENYGLYGEPNGPNISLDLCYPAKVAFSFYYNNCYGSGDAHIITNGVCVNKFYDGNVNGYPDAGEQPMGGVTFTLTGNGITQTQTTGDDGKAAFSNLPDGIYVVKEQAPSGYFAAVADSQFVYVFGGNATVNFGNVCIGPGGAKGLGFWIGKNGETALKNAGKLESALWQLREFSLRNADGTDFDPYTYSELRQWMQRANAKNMLYMLSAQMAAMYLNLEMGYVSYSSYIQTKGCSWANFTNTYSLIWSTHYYLLFNATGADRSYAECLKTSFDNANNNLTFAQLSPCSGTVTTATPRKPEELTNLAEAKVWPNPSNSYFTVTPGTKSGETVEIRVVDVNGRQVYTAVGSANMNYRFGDKLIAGLYFVEIRQGTNRSTIKVVKQ